MKTLIKEYIPTEQFFSKKQSSLRFINEVIDIDTKRKIHIYNYKAPNIKEKMGYLKSTSPK